jgi:tripartite-type tricarboxylate transporter receptor subunit TctC
MGKALGEASVRDTFLQSAQEPVGGSPEAFASLVREDFAKYDRLVRELNIKAN